LTYLDFSNKDMPKSPTECSSSQSDSVHQILKTSLRNGASPTFRYQQNPELVNCVTDHLAQILGELAYPDPVLNNVRLLIKNFDYRLAADYLHAHLNNSPVILNLYEQLRSVTNFSDARKLLYKLSRAHFFSKKTPTRKGDISYVSNINDLFSSENKNVTVYLADPTLESTLNDLLVDIGNGLGNFIEQQFDFPDLNALVNQGVVRGWFLPDGKAVISKRNNPKKPGKFHKEQLNYEAIFKKFDEKTDLYLGHDERKRDVCLRLARPFAVIWDGNSGRCYALSIRIEGISLEDILMGKRETTIRQTHIAHYRMILDALYDRGILWGDMSPRNILVQQRGDKFCYHIIDFEKTAVSETPICEDGRKDHCRGQICAEEFCIICSPEDVDYCFRGYFDPEEWDLESKEPVYFPRRPEVRDILHGRKLHMVTLGIYNQTDKEMLQARIPDINPINGERRFPGHLNFKVAHYLGSCADYNDAADYERKTTEILIAAKRNNCFDEAVLLLAEATDRLESVCVETEFTNILEGNLERNVPAPPSAAETLVHIIDSLYDVREKKIQFRDLCLRLKQ
jgi:hypothetical protein